MTLCLEKKRKITGRKWLKSLEKIKIIKIIKTYSTKSIKHKSMLLKEV